MGLYGDNGKENGNYYRILGLYWDNGKENGNYYSILGLYGDNGKGNGNYCCILGLFRDNGNYYDGVVLDLGFRALVLVEHLVTNIMLRSI